MPAQTPRIAVIACAVLQDEVACFTRALPHVVAREYLPQLLHNEPARLRAELQAAVARCEARADVDVIALAYGLCSRGVEGIRHGRCPLVIARAHDCVTLYLGSKERYAEYLKAYPGTYWYSPGWIRAHAPPGPDRDAYLKSEYEKKFDPEDVEYLLEQERAGLAHYNRAAYVALGEGAGETDGQREYTRRCAACLGWDFDHVRGDASLMRDLFTGPEKWDDARFLVVPPDHGIRLTADDSVVRAAPLAGEGG